jgi:hypothetical protein
MSSFQMNLACEINALQAQGVKLECLFTIVEQHLGYIDIVSI